MLYKYWPFLTPAAAAHTNSPSCCFFFLSTWHNRSLSILMQMIISAFGFCSFFSLFQLLKSPTLVMGFAVNYREKRWPQTSWTGLSKLGKNTEQSPPLQTVLRTKVWRVSNQHTFRLLPQRRRLALKSGGFYRVEKRDRRSNLLEEDNWRREKKKKVEWNW